ncbi:MAG: glycosyltransferase family 4 protein [Pleurocapsa sp.]
MRVAYICADPGIPVFGQKGCSIHVQEVIRSLLQKNVQVSLFTNRLGEKIPPDFQQVKVYPLPTIPKVERAVRERVARSINPDLELELSLAQPFDFIYERYSLWSYSAMEYARKMGIPGILEVNAPLILEQEKHRGLVDKAAAEAIARRVFEAASTIIAVSREVKEYVSQYVRDAETIKVIPNGVNPQRFKLNLPVKNTKQFTVGFVGSLKPWHGLPVLIEAFAAFHQQHPQARLLIVGDGKERDRLTQMIAEKNLAPAVHFTGAVSPEAVPYWLSQMDVAVAPYPHSDDFYFSPLKVYEYMAAGLPVIASHIGQIPEVIEDRVNGLLIPPGDEAALANALEYLWRSPLLRRRLGDSARSKILQHHTWEKVAEKILGFAQQQEKLEVIG